MNLKNHIVPIPLPLDQVVQSPVQPGLKHFQGGTWSGWINGQSQWDEVQHGKVSVKLCRGKRSGAVGRCSPEYEPAVCPGGQEEQQHPGLYQK